MLFVVVLVLMLLSVGHAKDNDEDPAAVARREQIRHRRQRFLSYAQRVSAAMDAVVNGRTVEDDETAKAGEEEASSLRSQLEQEAARHRRRRAELGLASGTVQGGPLHVASSLKEAAGEARTAASETFASLVRLAQVSAGASLEKETETDLTARTEARKRTLQAVRQERLLKQRDASWVTKAEASPVAAEGMDSTASGSNSGPGRLPRALPETVDGLSFKCTGGVQAYTAESRWVCPWGRQGVRGCLSDTRSCGACRRVRGLVTCVCPQDSVLYRSDASVICLSRPLDLRPELPGAALCRDELSASLGLALTTPGEYCLAAQRTDTLSFDVTWRFSLLDDATIMGMRGAGGDSILPVPVSRNTTTLFVAGPDNTYLSDTYDALAVNPTLFTYRVPPTDGGNFSLLASHPAVRTAAAFSAVFSFSSPEVMPPLMQEELLSSPEALDKYFSSPDATSTHTVTYDLSTVPDQCIEGGRLYLEVGVGGREGVYLSYRVARIHVDVEGLPEPPVRYRYRRPFNVLYIFLIAVIAAIVVGCALAVLWYCCQRQDEPEDDLVAKAQRNKARQEELQRGRDEKNKRSRGVGGGREEDTNRAR